MHLAADDVLDSGLPSPRLKPPKRVATTEDRQGGKIVYAAIAAAEGVDSPPQRALDRNSESLGRPLHDYYRVPHFLISAANKWATPPTAAREPGAAAAHFSIGDRKKWRERMFEQSRLFRSLSGVALAAGLSLALAACGHSTSDRALSGAGIGAAGGAALGAVTGGSALGGAVLGGAAGAAAGALTDEDDIDLGKPIWRR